ncbi:MAG: CNNM domain-containing protein [Phycisphaerae bacterium]|nr:CNNM domain-containing protein [Phycisphaerae bacterium]
MIAMVLVVEWAAWLVVLAACLALAGLLAGMETGIYVLNRIRLDLRSEGGGAAARTLRTMLDRPDHLLTVLLVGNNLAVYWATFAVSAMLVLAGYRQHVELYAVIVAAPLLLVVGESVPKNVFQRLAETLTYRMARGLAAVDTLLTYSGLVPLVRGFTWLLFRALRITAARRPPLGREGLSAIVAEGQASGALTHSQSVMADRVMNISDVRLKDVMIPMARVHTASAGASREQLVALAAEVSHSRLPVVDADGKVTGILDVLDILSGREATVPPHRMRVPLVLSAEQGVTDALYQMQRQNAHMAIVEGANGKHLGMVTIKDLVEEIVGELEAW